MAAMDWAGGLPADVLLAIFNRLDHIDILMAVNRVCRPWRAAARDEPSLWRRITISCQLGIARLINRCGMACEAVRRSAGQCEAFYGKYAGDDGFLIYLAEQCPSLRSLRLICCSGVTDVGFTKVVKALPLLEELELSLCDNVRADGVYQVAGEVCPQLNRFRLRKRCFYIEKNMDKDAPGIASMRGLRSLQLFGHVISNKGLETILDNCSHLESLDIRRCLNIDMDETLLAKCARIKMIKLPNDPIDDYDLLFESPYFTVQSRHMRIQSPHMTYAWGRSHTYLSHYYDRDYYDRNYPPLLR